MPLIEVKDITISYDFEKGDEQCRRNETCVLVNGLGCHMRYSASIKSILVKKGYDVLCFDNRGMGNTVPYPDENDLTVREMANDLKELLEALCISQPVHLCGHSMGGMICAEFALLFPECVETLVLSQALAFADPSLAMTLQSFAQFVELAFDPASSAYKAFLKIVLGLTSSNHILESIGFELLSELALQLAGAAPIPVSGYKAQVGAIMKYDFRASFNENLGKFEKGARFPKTLSVIATEDRLVPFCLSSPFCNILNEHHELLFKSRANGFVSTASILETSHSFFHESPEFLVKLICSFSAGELPSESKWDNKGALVEEINR
eukprot:Nk52_evm19s343 gene=Nk52_evmTU19s343